MRESETALSPQSAVVATIPFSPDAALRAQAPDSSSIGKGLFVIAACVTLVVGITSAVVWPGAACFHWDEPVLIGQAFFYNQSHRLANRGLAGNFGIAYGPFPTQCYQLLLMFTHDLRVVVFCRAFISSAMMAGSLLWLSKTLRLTPWFAAAVVLAPFLNWTERALWDATFAIPISALAVAAYASFLGGKSRLSLAVALAAATLDPLIHPQGLPLFIAIVGHAVWRHRLDLRRHRIAVAIPLVILLVLNAGYSKAFVEGFVANVLGMFHSGYPGRASGREILLSSLSGPFLGGKNLNGENWVVPRTGLPGAPVLAEYAINTAYIVIPLIWLGILASVVRVIRCHLQQRGKTQTTNLARAASAVTVRDSIIRIALAILLLQIVLAVVLRVPPDPQYSFGTYSVHILFAWFGVEFLRKLYLGHLVTAVYGAAVAYLTFGGAWSVHVHGWNRGLLSPSLDNQIKIAEQLNRYSDKIVWTEVENYQRFPRDIQTLRLLIPPPPGVTRVPSPHGLFIRYERNGDPTSFRVELVELGPGFRPPASPGAEDTMEYFLPGVVPGRPEPISPLITTQAVDLSLPRPLY